MAVMVTFTLKADVQAYNNMHPQMLPVAVEAGMIFHSAHELGDQIGIVDFWPSEAAWNSFAAGPLAEGMKAMGLASPDDIKVTPVLDTDTP